MSRIRVLAGLAGLLLSMAAQTAEVVVSIKPLHAIVSRLLSGVSTPQQLLPDNASPHHYSMRPSEVLALRQAPLFIWLGPELEVFLKKPVANRSEPLSSFSFASLPQLDWLNYRSLDEAHAEHSHQQDPHFWLDPLRVKAALPALTDALQSQYPEAKALLRQNAESFSRELEALDQELRQLLMPVQQRPFLVYHDSYQYLAQRYQLNVRGAIVKEPQEGLSVRQILRLQQQIEQQQIQCIFEDAEYPNRKLQALFAGKPGKIGVLDSLGLKLSTGSALYLELMRQLAQDLRRCLES